VAAVKDLAAIDRWTLAYAAVAALALLLRWPANTPAAGLLPWAHVLLAATAFLAPRARRAGPVGRFLGDWYPVIIAAFLYREVGLLNSAAGTSHDVLIQSWERRLFGRQVSVDWIRAWPWPWLSVLMHVGYLSYYFIVAGPPLALWLTGRIEAGRRVLLAIMATFYICYSLFLVFPVAGPRYAFPLAQNAATGVGIASFTQDLLDEGAAWGTAFPSSHVAVAWVVVVAAAWEWSLLGALTVPVALLLTLATVYGQFHYGIDAAAGALLAAAILWMLRWQRSSGAKSIGAAATAKVR
jgi:membrane-associated phospholipid phosphatase